MDLSTDPVLCSLFASLFTWGITALGAAMVFLFSNVNGKLMDCTMGFGAGVMISASFFSLLVPAIEFSTSLGNPWLLPAIGFLCGGALIVVGDRILGKLSKFSGKKQRCVLLVLAMTLHNIPEGMVVGVAFAGASMAMTDTSFATAIILAIGIGLQNFPEGAGISLPLRQEGCSKLKSFMTGQFSGMVEVPGAILGAVLALSLDGVLPFFLALSAGAMIAVVTSELIPTSVEKNKNLATIGVIAGFLIMMVMDVALG